MARLIKPTPMLDQKNTESFLRRVDEGAKRKTGPVPTPKLADTLKEFIANVENEK